jgi:predicted metalloprotease with PDZ domain
MLVRALAIVTVLAAVAGVARAAEPGWRYEVAVGEGARELRVEATIAAGFSDEFSVDEGAERFVHDVAVDAGGGWHAVQPKDDSWFIGECRRGCKVRYRFELERAAAALDGEEGERLGAVTQAPPSTWLLHPLHAAAGRAYRFHVTTPPGIGFVSGVHRVGRDSYGADVTQLRDSPYSAFGPLAVETMHAGGAAIDLAFLPSQRTLDHAAVVQALSHAADVVARYYQRFPVERLLVLVVPQPGDGLHGRTLGGGGATLMLYVGISATRDQLMESWVPAHELTHLAFPTVPRAQLWIAEGLATYLEPIERARAGDLSAEKVWRDLVDGLPQGEPDFGDRGLDHTRTWGRIYWGGALYCMVADLEIRRRTNNRRSLDDAMRAIVRAGGTLENSWALERALAVGDAAVGVPVLTELWKRWGDAPVKVDLDDWWKRLGIKKANGRLVFDDDAPLAAVRRAVTAAK